MSAAIGKLAPTAIVATVVAWCCWSYLPGVEPGEGVPQSSDLPHLAQSLLSPAIVAVSDRDPFQMWKAPQTASTESGEPTAPNTRPEAQPPKKDITDILSSVVLGATYIQGDRRVALINGQVCEQGEPLAISESMAEPCIVTRILAHAVLLQHGGRTVELRYRDPLLKAKPSKISEQRHDKCDEPG